MSKFKFFTIQFGILLVSSSLYAASNMRIACLMDPRTQNPELVLFEYAQDQDLTESELLERFRGPDTRQFRVTHYRGVRRRPGESLLTIARNVRADQMIVAPMVVEGRTLGGIFAFNQPYMSADGQILAEDRRFASLNYMLPSRAEATDVAAQLTFSSRRLTGLSDFSTTHRPVIHQMTCTRPEFYTVGQVSSSVPPADTGPSTTLPTTK